MLIRCWGSRGSIPVSGPEYVRYGGDTTCMEVRSSAGDVVVIDAGSGIRRLGESLAREGAQDIHLLFTHAHLDHIIGMAFFTPMYRKDARVTIYGRRFDRKGSYRSVLAGVVKDPYCPVDISKVDATLRYVALDDKPFAVGALHISTVPLSHPNGGLGYRIEEGGRSFVFLTDNELDYRHPTGRPQASYASFARGADLLIHDAEYTSKDYARGWGHSLFNSVVKLGLKAGVKQLGLFHLNQRRTDAEMDTMVSEAQAMVRADGAPMQVSAIGRGWQVELR
jgi:phosphoribosyl 1,2-cyclic phosphodiesterase